MNEPKRGFLFRPLRADEVEVRVGGSPIPHRETPGGQVTYWLCPLLLYKDARADMTVLDETVGPLGWKREHRMEGGRCFCTVSVWDEAKGQWISRTDVGSPTAVEEVKGECSDAFKRACTCLGIGRELYSAGQVYACLLPEEMSGDRVLVRFRVAALETDPQTRRITRLAITDSSGQLRCDISPRRPSAAGVGDHESQDRQPATV